VSEIALERINTQHFLLFRATFLLEHTEEIGSSLAMMFHSQKWQYPLNLHLSLSNPGTIAFQFSFCFSCFFRIARAVIVFERAALQNARRAKVGREIQRSAR
jgi:hypothetical protein